MSNGVTRNPYTLFLIFILLLLSTDKSADVKLGFVRGIIDQTTRSLSTLREGINAMQMSFEHAHSLFMGSTEKPGETE
ncbi:hypothetical protein [Desulfotruncus alcoholivorax]|uniref:hypothetical protein n=1 Tax=Desulfotruncus alcoholivorax TaxID=265477 RepID=UPI00041EF984|nr:hypothetical protein [Desulfotruncus alcoholivorax]